jgi:hypothetical protein
MKPVAEGLGRNEAFRAQGNGMIVASANDEPFFA